ncbi:choline dehydrogenase [Colletotrichum truncatum]|uniref:Choline dehydrogenase n=1 Tax=Colletotrichum truncatum TaxID=5467 RepID=A0ACC3ZG29_COLTU
MFWPFSHSYPERRVVDVDRKSFDYVIVGGGTAACALASRLSEDLNVSVLLISKGKIQDDWISSIPIVGGARENQGSNIDTLWSETDDRWDGIKARIFTSQSLGGASNINGLMYTRGSPGNYNKWAALGNDEWSFEKCEPYFKKLENAHSQAEAPYRGHSDEAPLRYCMVVTDLRHSIELAASHLNLPVRHDANNPKAPSEGLFTVEHMIDKSGYRHSSYAAYLPKSLALERKERLTICGGAVATRLQLSQDGTRVTGVYLLDHLNQKAGKECLVQANREVIICCGTLFTPQLLMLSGIGPREKLKDHKINCVQDLPGVGANLHDHVAFAITFEVRLIDSYLRMLNPFTAIWLFLVYLVTKTGILSTSGGRLCAWIQSKNIDEATMTVKSQGNAFGENHDREDAALPENLPDLELLFFNAAFDYQAGKGYCGFQVALVQPFSEGRIELASSDPLALPKYHYQYITDPRDWAVARKGARFAMNYVEALRKTDYPFNCVWHLAPGATTGTVKGSWTDVSDEEIDAYIKKRMRNFYHPTSTCRMAPVEDGGVVGQDLRVHGFTNLRIADASVFPSNTSAHTAAPIYMVAERCADFIKNYWARSN